jgi:hypothetical protein
MFNLDLILKIFGGKKRKDSAIYVRFYLFGFIESGGKPLKQSE